MSIVTSQIIKQTVQPNGSINVHERHTDHVGATYDQTYKAAFGADLATHLAIRAIELAEELKRTDMHRAIFTASWDYTLIHANDADLATYVRSLYRESIQKQTAQIALRILEWITNGRYTQTQIRNAFSLTQLQWDTLTAKMTALITNLQAVQAATGE